MPTGSQIGIKDQSILSNIILIGVNKVFFNVSEYLLSDVNTFNWLMHKNSALLNIDFIF